MRVELGAKHGDIAGLRRRDEDANGSCLGLGPRAALPDVAGQQLQGSVTPLLGDLVDGAAVRVQGRGVEAGREGAAHGIGIAGARGLEHARPVAARGRDAVDVRLERAP